jgi:hypothetical protein
MAASPCDVVHSGRPPKTRHPRRARVGRVLRRASGRRGTGGRRLSASTITGGGTLYDGPDCACVLDELSDEIADHGPRPHAMDARGRLANVRVAGPRAPAQRDRLVRHQALVTPDELRWPRVQAPGIRCAPLRRGHRSAVRRSHGERTDVLADDLCPRSGAFGVFAGCARSADMRGQGASDGRWRVTGAHRGPEPPPGPR